MDLEKSLETLHGKFLIRPYRNEDEQNVLELWEAAFGKKMLTEIWRWKFHDNPFGRQIMLCFNEQNKAVVMYAGIPFSANWLGQNVLFTQLIDNMSHPDFRQATNGRKGLFIQTAEHFFNVYGGKSASIFHYGFPGLKHFKLGSLLLNYSPVAEGDVYLKADPYALKVNRLPMLGKVNKITVVGKQFDAFWKKASRFYPFSIKRNSQFLRWRFVNHPTNQYDIYTYTNLIGKIQAYIIISNTKSHASIIDILSLPGQKGLSKIFQSIHSELRQKGITQIDVWLPQNHFVSTNLLAIGFTKEAEPIGIIPTGKSLYDKLDIDYCSKNIYFTMGDGDLF